MKVKEIDLSSYDYKRICVYEVNQTHYPENFEELVLKTHGEKDIVEENGVFVNAFGWLMINIKCEQVNI